MKLYFPEGYNKIYSYALAQTDVAVSGGQREVTVFVDEYLM